MHLAGRIEKDGRFWMIEVPILDVATQGRTRKEAYCMIKDAIESLANEQGFSVEVVPGTGKYFQVTSNDPSKLMAFLLKRQRQKQGLSLADMAERLGQKSRNAYARYEQGKADPTVKQLLMLLSVVNPRADIVITERLK